MFCGQAKFSEGGASGRDIGGQVTQALQSLRAAVGPHAAGGEVSVLDVTEVHALHADFVWRSLHRLGVHDADLPDVMQEVFVVVHRRRRDFDPASSIRGWLFGICVRLVKNYRRKAFRRRERFFAEVPEDRFVGGGSDPETEVAAREARRTAQRLLDKLDPEKRAVLVMFEVEAMSCDAIAEALGIPVGTVYSRLHAARHQLAKVLERWQRSQSRSATRAGGARRST
jgi:RNA polymerase sigma-70 factor (ECF subfamily)